MSRLYNFRQLSKDLLELPIEFGRVIASIIAFFGFLESDEPIFWDRIFTVIALWIMIFSVTFFSVLFTIIMQMILKKIWHKLFPNFKLVPKKPIIPTFSHRALDLADELYDELVATEKQVIRISAGEERPLELTDSKFDCY